MTFSFLMLTLLIKGLTIIPVVIDGDYFRDSHSTWMDSIFALTPLLCFLIAIMLNTVRWWEIWNKISIYHTSSDKLAKIMRFVYVFYFLLAPTAYVWSWYDSIPELVVSIYLAVATWSYYVAHLVLIIMNFWLIFLSNRLQKHLPHLYK
jgi:magnesium-transporting ATPase (P-type)